MKSINIDFWQFGLVEYIWVIGVESHNHTISVKSMLFNVQFSLYLRPEEGKVGQGVTVVI